MYTHTHIRTHKHTHTNTHTQTHTHTHNNNNNFQYKSNQYKPGVIVKKQGQMKLTISIRALVVHHDNECLKSTINM